MPPRPRLVDSDGVPVALVRRFDRTADGRRLMYMLAATLLGVERGDPQEHFYTEIVNALRVHGAAVQADIEELWRRMAYSISDHQRGRSSAQSRDSPRGPWTLAAGPGLQ